MSTAALPLRGTVLALALSVSARMTQAQSVLQDEPQLPFPATHGERCKAALRILLEPPAQTRLIQAAWGVTECEEPTSGHAMATLLGVHRTRSDSLLLDALALGAAQIPHAAVFEAGLEIATDSAASVAMRVTTLRAALHVLMPGHSTGLRPDTIVWPRHRDLVCAISSVDHPPQRRSALPADASARLLAVATQLAADSATPPLLRDAAYCVAQRARYSDTGARRADVALHPTGRPRKLPDTTKIVAGRLPSPSRLSAGELVR
jgi:hypothetical protein